MQVTLRANAWDGLREKRLDVSSRESAEVLGFSYDETRNIQETVNKAAHWVIPASVFASAATKAQAASAATDIADTSGLIDRMQPLINMIQDLALPVGIIVASWGLIEIIIGNPAGRQKIKYSIVGYIGIFLIPFLFYEIHHAFRGV